MSETRKIGSSGELAALPEDGYVALVDSGGSVRRVSVANMLAAVSVGGRNLLAGTAEWKGWKSKTSGTVTSETRDVRKLVKAGQAFSGMGIGANVTEGVTYIFSAEFNTVDGRVYPQYPSPSYIGLTATAEGIVTNLPVKYLGDGWYRVSAMYKCTKSGVTVLEAESITSGGCICGPKFETGNIPTDWSPAPEDCMPINSISGGVERGSLYAMTDWQEGGRHERDEEAECAVLRLLFGRPLAAGDGREREREDSGCETGRPHGDGYGHAIVGAGDGFQRLHLSGGVHDFQGQQCNQRTRAGELQGNVGGVPPSGRRLCLSENDDKEGRIVHEGLPSRRLGLVDSPSVASGKEVAYV